SPFFSSPFFSSPFFSSPFFSSPFFSSPFLSSSPPFLSSPFLSSFLSSPFLSLSFVPPLHPVKTTRERAIIIARTFFMVGAVLPTSLGERTTGVGDRRKMRSRLVYSHFFHRGFPRPTVPVVSIMMASVSRDR